MWKDTHQTIKEKLFMTLVEEGRVDFIQGEHNSGVLLWGREIGVNSKYTQEKWSFISEKQKFGGWKINKLN